MDVLIGLNTADVGKIQMYCNIYSSLLLNKQASFDSSIFFILREEFPV